jgi:hypothetical protein
MPVLNSAGETTIVWPEYAHVPSSSGERWRVPEGEVRNEPPAQAQFIDTFAHG